MLRTAIIAAACAAVLTPPAAAQELRLEPYRFNAEGVRARVQWTPVSTPGGRVLTYVVDARTAPDSACVAVGYPPCGGRQSVVFDTVTFQPERPGTDFYYEFVIEPFVGDYWLGTRIEPMPLVRDPSEAELVFTAGWAEPVQLEASDTIPPPQVWLTDPLDPDPPIPPEPPDTTGLSIAYEIHGPTGHLDRLWATVPSETGATEVYWTQSDGEVTLDQVGHVHEVCVAWTGCEATDGNESPRYCDAGDRDAIAAVLWALEDRSPALAVEFPAEYLLPTLPPPDGCWEQTPDEDPDPVEVPCDPDPPQQVAERYPACAEVRRIQ